MKDIRVLINSVTFSIRAVLLILIVGMVNLNLAEAQRPNLKFEISEVNFGKIASNAYPPRTVEFQNISDEKLAILLIDKPEDVKVSFARRFYEPGEKGKIALTYEPRNTGDFDLNINIYINLDDQPYTLKLKGTAISILECFPDPDNMLKRSIEVIDKETKEPVPEAELELVHNNRYNNPLKFRVDKTGKAIKELPIGLYHITAEKSGYEQLTEERFVPKSQPVLILELNPVKKVPPVPPGSEPVPKPHDRQAIDPEITVTSADLPEDKYAANNLIFLLDISTSMKSSHKFMLLQQSVNNLTMILRGIDKVSIIAYSTEAQVVLTDINGLDKDRIIDAVQDLHPYGITRGVKGLNMAYDLAENSYIRNGNNQIILMTDGEFSEKGLGDSYYQQMLSEYASRGISLSIIGFGINEEAIDRMKVMSEAGEGSFILVGSEDFVKEVLINEVKAKSLLPE